MILYTPEISIFSLNKKKLLKTCSYMNDDLYLKEIQKLAKKFKKWILIGSIATKISKKKLANRSILIDRNGRIRKPF